MKKKNIKPIVISTLLAAAFGATSLGTSFALFTDSAETSINVTAGKVDVSAGLKSLATYSAVANAQVTENYVLDENNAKYVLTAQTPGSFIDGGKATYENTTLTLDRIVPGDKVDFTLDLGNSSNVNIKYRIVYEVINDGNAQSTAYLDLVKGLETTIARGTTAEEKFNGLKLYKSNWINAAANGELQDVDFSIYFPLAKDNRYQNKTAKIKLSVEAVQGNAVVSDIKEVETVEEDFVSPSAAVVESQDTVVSAMNEAQTAGVKITIPAAEINTPVGSEVEVVVGEVSMNQNASENTAVLDFDVTVKVDGVSVSTFHEPISVEVFVGRDLYITKVTHNDVVLNDYDYNSQTGIVSFTTTSFSPFSVEYLNLKSYEETTNKKVLVLSDGEITYYDTLHEVIADIPENNTKSYYVKLLDDLEDGAMYLLRRSNIEIDFGGHTLTGTSAIGNSTLGRGVFMCLLGDNVVMRNGVIEFSSTNTDYHAIVNGGNMELRNLEVVNTTGSGFAGAVSNGPYNLTGTLDIYDCYLHSDNGLALTNNKGTATINGSSSKFSSNYQNGTIKNNSSATLVVNDGEILNTNETDVIKVNTSAPKITINGGTFSKPVLPGKFATHSANFILNGYYKANGNETYTVLPYADNALIAKITKAGQEPVEYRGAFDQENLALIHNAIEAGDKVELFDGLYDVKYFDLFDLPSDVEIIGHENTLYAFSDSVKTSDKLWSSDGKIEGIKFFGGFAVTSNLDKTTLIKDCVFDQYDTNTNLDSGHKYHSAMYELLAYNGKGTTIIDGCSFLNATDGRSVNINSTYENTVIYRNLKTFKNCMYIAHADEAESTTLLIDNCNLNGWFTIGTTASTTISNCKFYKDENTAGYAFFRPYSDTLVENCVFESTFEGIDTKDSSSAVTIEFKNCKNGSNEYLTTSDIFNLLSTEEDNYTYNLRTILIHNNGTTRTKLLLEGDGTNITLAGTEVIE